MGGGRRWPLKLVVKGTSSPVRLAVGIAVAGLAWNASPRPAVAADSSFSSSREKISSAVDGVIRSSRAIYTIAFVVVDYKYSLRSLPPGSSDYRMKVSEVHLRSAKRLLKLCEANKGFYVKAGQFVSSLRQVPKEYTSILSSLQDQAIPCHFKDIEDVIASNLGKDLSEIFLAFDEQPIAAASIAQVHHGLLKNNQEVAVKVQYPGLEQKMKIDITTMAILSKSVSRIFPDYRFDRIIEEFERAMALELDFIQEAKNSERAARYFRNNKIVRIPGVFWDLTTSQVLTMQFCSGHKVDDVEFMRDSNINPREVAKSLMDIFAQMIFVHGFVHGDPHPGNILVSREGRTGFSIVLLDHGIYRELDERFRSDYCELWKALILLDSKKIQLLGKKFGVGKYSKYFPVIFTGRTMESKSALGTQLSNEERRLLKQELRSLKMDDISAFMECLPSDFFPILRTDGLLRSILGKLGAPRHVRLLAYAKYALYGLETHENLDHGKFLSSSVLCAFRANISYFWLRILLEFLTLVSQIEDARRSLANKLKRILHKVVRFFYQSSFFLV
ncbi:unnamed protein product [Musa acuminata subsp. malaccensis]|uniref:(wild Malaysian banana) hypothetical protein n=1 Tax=Musa acuminata subsp. malaccensis TaxID=214687 RepID=A0A8D7B0X0_MUSAM|nr:unnamed protein product [Musa acuminata subsp. malaccensis]